MGDEVEAIELKTGRLRLAPKIQNKIFKPFSIDADRVAPVIVEDIHWAKTKP